MRVLNGSYTDFSCFNLVSLGVDTLDTIGITCVAATLNHINCICQSISFTRLQCSMRCHRKKQTKYNFLHKYKQNGDCFYTVAHRISNVNSLGIHVCPCQLAPANLGPNLLGNRVPEIPNGTVVVVTDNRTSHQLTNAKPQSPVGIDTLLPIRFPILFLCHAASIAQTSTRVNRFFIIFIQSPI